MTNAHPVISLDCEANGLGSWPFAAAATLSTDDGGRAVWMARCPIPGAVDPWVAENVLPNITDMPINAVDVFDLWKGWLSFYSRCLHTYPDLVVICHVAVPVEAGFLTDAHADNIKTAPYPLIDVAGLLHAAGYDPTTVDGYLTANGLPAPAGRPHHPLYDARATATCYRHLMGRFAALRETAHA